ncbi:MAG: helix-turn-helix domain-containing protein [Treponema sp.]|jgi:AraC-like DNA-binding protein/ligand-binding sensor protein|nr:helix-turn-helix domain-containing protein [Treponema sp.]
MEKKYNIQNNSGLINLKGLSNPVLLEACKVLGTYAKATGAFVCVYDQDYMPIPVPSAGNCTACQGAELFNKASGAVTMEDGPSQGSFPRNTTGVFSKKNPCFFCIKHHTGVEPKTIEDLASSPCSGIHQEAIKESYRYGGCYIYRCEIGFKLWTSPLYFQGHFVGGLLGSGFREDGPESRLREGLCYPGGSEITDQEFIHRINSFPIAPEDKIRALAELMLICAESLSSENDDYYETIKRRAEQQARLMASVQELGKKQESGAAIPSYPLDKERMLLTALRRGDTETGKTILNDILAVLLFSSPDQFKYIQFRAIELAVLLSRTAFTPGNPDKAILESNNSYIKSIQESKTIEELTDMLNITVERMAEHIFSFQEIRHAAALRKAERFIQENYSHKISLQEIAKVSGLSAPYFSTIFKEERGENLSTYLNRLRIEKASRLLLKTDMPLSDIARACGFEDQSWFSRMFKSYTGLSPGKYRGQHGGPVAEISDSNFSEDCRDKMMKGEANPGEPTLA